MDDLRGAFIAEAEIDQRRMVARTFIVGCPASEVMKTLDRLINSWRLRWTADETRTSKGDLHGFTVFGRLGKFFWQQMTRIP